MRVLGAIMFIAGVLIGLLLLLPMLLIFAFQTSDLGSILLSMAVLIVMLGTPSFLLIFFGVKFFRKKKPAVAVSQSYTAQYAPGQASPQQSAILAAQASSVRYESGIGGGNAPSIKPTKTLSCRNCGASKTVVSGQAEACDYCGTLLK